MYKTIAIFKNIEDLGTFHSQYLELLLPRINNLPGSICTDITTVSTLMTGDELGELQYMVETHFESLEIMNEVLSSPKISQFLTRWLEETPADISYFTGNTVRIYSDAAKQKLVELTEESHNNTLSEVQSLKYIESSIKDDFK
ncbi:hypothetical protein MK805_08960 [Shimazuella sp. AN120528]|uniref:hypothetical protein n=1 Tax=Shimazuella soli TaxID=1892854 RepID=UPI001F0FCB49|nr:hypothetical protein [Shimazuella soli]MCH5585099.1 hypothetical protein [Shimazuella soli]